MRTRIVLTTALAALLPLAAFGQIPAAPTAPATPATPATAPATPSVAAAPGAPPAPPAPPHRGRMPNDQPRGPYTFLGVETSRVQRVVSEQLGLPRGFGLVVDYVVPKSAADLAGVQQSDIIRTLNDQIIVNSEQLGVLVRSFSDGSSVNLTVLRKGQEMKLTAKLQQKEAKSDHRAFGYNWNFDDSDDMEDWHAPDLSSVREAVSRAKAEALRAGDEARRAGDEAMRAAAKNLRIITASGGTVKASHIDLGKAQIVFSDEKGELRIETVNGKKMLTAKDATGKVLFNGPIETEEERTKIPADVRKRYENLEHQELPPIPPSEQLTPNTPNLQESAQLQNKNLKQAVLVPTSGSGWRRDTVLL